MFERNPRDSFESRLTDRLSARITVQTAARHELTRADAFTRTEQMRLLEH